MTLFSLSLSLSFSLSLFLTHTLSLLKVRAVKSMIGAGAEMQHKAQWRRTLESQRRSDIQKERMDRMGSKVRLIIVVDTPTPPCIEHMNVMR